MNKRGASHIWDYIAWIVFVGIVIWVFLKLVGVIHTPVWLEYAPIGGVIYLAGWAMHKLERATDDIKDTINKLEQTTDNLKDIESDMNVVRRNCPHLKKKD